MDTGESVTLDAASPADSALLANLLELYIHDVSDVFPDVELGADGRFGYPRLPLYWSEPERRFAFLIRRNGRVAGFALAMRESHRGQLDHPRGGGEWTDVAREYGGAEMTETTAVVKGRPWHVLRVRSNALARAR